MQRHPYEWPILAENHWPNHGRKLTMRLRGLRAKQEQTYKNTTKRNKAHPVAPNLLQRDFSTDRPNEKWLTDITYIRTGEGWLDLAVVLDLYSRRIVGWAMSGRMTGELTIKALQMALSHRDVEPGLIHHSDQGSQYTTSGYRRLLKEWGIKASMNSVGTWYDNAPVESFFATLKAERVHHCTYRTRAEARADIFSYIEAFYNRRRIHSALGSVSPVAYEQLYHVTTGFA